MIKNILFLLVFSLFFIACDKQRRTTTKIDGEWEISVYKITDIEGLAEYAVCSGSYIFNSCTDKSSVCDYSCNLNFTFPGNTGTTIESGTFLVLPDGGYMDVTNMNAMNIPTSVYNYRILTITRTDLQLEFTDSTNNIHSLFLKKK